MGKISISRNTFLDSTLAPKPALAFHATLIRQRYEPTPTGRHERRIEENIGTCGRYMRTGETDILTGLLYRKPPPSTPPRPASRAPRASLPAAPLSSAKSPRRSLVSLPTSAASLSCCATPRTSVPASSLRSAYVYSILFPLSPGWLCCMDYVGFGSIWSRSCCIGTVLYGSILQRKINFNLCLDKPTQLLFCSPVTETYGQSQDDFH